jgi:hypothetical protein
MSAETHIITAATATVLNTTIASISVNNSSEGIGHGPW